MIRIQIVQEATILLGSLGMDDERRNERSALTLLALLGLRPQDSWGDSTNPTLGTRAIMDWMRDHYMRDYAANTRETIRRFTLHQFVEALLVQQNPDRPDRPVNSPKWNYQVTDEALAVIKSHGTSRFEARLALYLSQVPSLRTQYAAARELARLPIVLPNGELFSLSPGGQNVLIKQMVDHFCPQFTPGGELLYIGDADSKFSFLERARLESLGVSIDRHGKMPDLVVYMADRNWLVLLEAASSHGPVDAKRRTELASIFGGSTAGIVYVSCFPDRKEMRKYLHALAWGTEVWCAEDPAHLIHFDGERFLGPHSY